MKGHRKLSPNVEFQPLPYLSLMSQEVKLPAGEVIVEHYNDITLLLQENKLLNNLAPEDIRFMIDSIGGNPEVSQSFSDDDLISACKSRHIQDMSSLTDWLEYEFESTKQTKKSWLDKLKDFVKGDKPEKISFAENKSE